MLELTPLSINISGVTESEAFQEKLESEWRERKMKMMNQKRNSILLFSMFQCKHSKA